jgi:hypothetical protein
VVVVKIGKADNHLSLLKVERTPTGNVSVKHLDLDGKTLLYEIDLTDDEREELIKALSEV